MRFQSSTNEDIARAAIAISGSGISQRIYDEAGLEQYYFTFASDGIGIRNDEYGTTSAELAYVKQTSTGNFLFSSPNYMYSFALRNYNSNININGDSFRWFKYKCINC